MNICKIVLLLSIVYQTHSSKILAIMTVPSHSHHLWNMVYLKALAERGHEITYVGFDEIKTPVKNIRHIFLEHGYDFQSSMDYNELSNGSPFLSVFFFGMWLDYVSDSLIKQPGFQNFLDRTMHEKFDLVVFDTAGPVFQLGAVDLIGRPPLIGITAFATPALSLENTGTPYPVADNPHNMLPLRHTTYFWDRFKNWMYFFIEWFVREKHINSQDALMRKFFGPNIRDIRQIIDDMNINMVNANWAMEGTFPITPGLIPVGGLHIKEPKTLPKDLKIFLDESPEGVIYFSLGSNIQSIFLKEKELKILIAAFKRLAPMKVLWKWESDEMVGKPDNVRIQKWLPQTDILAHPNVKVFVTHGGMLSSQEAIYLGVPIVGIPIFLDQHVNVLRAVSAGYGEVLQFSHLSSDTVVTAITKVVRNSSYENRVQKLSTIFKDQLNSPLDTAVFWTEYAIRHNGAHHLRPASKKLNWFQNNLYDIFLLFISFIIIILFISLQFLKFLRKAVFRIVKKIKKE